MNDDIESRVASMVRLLRSPNTTDLLKVRMAKELIGLAEFCPVAQRRLQEAQIVLASLQRKGAVGSPCAQLTQLKQSLGMRHLVVVINNITDPFDERWTEQTLLRMPASHQLGWFDVALSRACDTACGAPSSADVLGNLWGLLEATYAA